MFDDTLDSSWDERSRRGLTTLTSFGLQALAVGVAAGLAVAPSDGLAFVPPALDAGQSGTTSGRGSRGQNAREYNHAAPSNPASHHFETVTTISDWTCQLPAMMVHRKLGPSGPTSRRDRKRRSAWPAELDWRRYAPGFAGRTAAGRCLRSVFAHERGRPGPQEFCRHILRWRELRAFRGRWCCRR